MGPWLQSLLLRFAGAPAEDAAGGRPDRPLETRLLALTAGAVRSSPYGDPSRMPTVEWEGLQYRVDPAAATLRRLQNVRDVMGGTAVRRRAAVRARGRGAAERVQPGARPRAHPVAGAGRARASTGGSAAQPVRLNRTCSRYCRRPRRSSRLKRSRETTRRRPARRKRSSRQPTAISPSAARPIGISPLCCRRSCTRPPSVTAAARHCSAAIPRRFTTSASTGSTPASTRRRRGAILSKSASAASSGT